jgi:lipid-A-disaccharide synthase
VSQTTQPVRIGIVAGEASGDLLGARLIAALKRHLPDARFEGIAGPEMQAQGCHSLFPLERLSVFGLTDILGRYPELRRIRGGLIAHFLADPPDVYIGVDSPGFNLGVEEALHGAGVRTVHYVSPQVWAWRTWRVRRIRRAVNRILVLFPFEETFYARHGVNATFVGHPLADEIPPDYDKLHYRRELGLPLDRTVVALLPGSRASELRRHAGLFVQTAAWLASRRTGVHFVAPFVNHATRAMFEHALAQEGQGLPVTCLDGRSRDVMAAADAVLLASGTATLEAALLRKPMVVTYRVPWLMYYLVRLFAHVDMYSLPNHLAGRRIVPELMQGDATAGQCGAAIEALLDDPAKAEAEQQALAAIHRDLRRNASERAAAAVMEVLGVETGMAE